jgi:hypothetical protein
MTAPRLSSLSSSYRAPFRSLLLAKRGAGDLIKMKAISRCWRFNLIVLRAGNSEQKYFAEHLPISLLFRSLYQGTFKGYLLDALITAGPIPFVC